MGVEKLRVTLLKHTPEPQELVAMGAKLCYSSAGITELEQGVAAKDQGPFLKRLLGSGHLSPIEHAVFTFGVEGVSRSLLAQITRHRIASFSVKSQRYVSEAVKDRRDGGVFGYVIPPGIKAMGAEYVAIYQRQMEQMQKWYDFWVEKLQESSEGNAVYEDARFVLPNATATKLVVTMNARELLHFFALRCCNRAQWEIRALAIEMLRLVKPVAPLIFKDAGPGCLRGGCPEGRMSCGKSRAVKEMFDKL
jgi:thymidylate synthase (FAD)